MNKNSYCRETEFVCPIIMYGYMLASLQFRLLQCEQLVAYLTEYRSQLLVELWGFYKHALQLVCTYLLKLSLFGWLYRLSSNKKCLAYNCITGPCFKMFLTKMSDTYPSTCIASNRRFFMTYVGIFSIYTLKTSRPSPHYPPLSPSDGSLTSMSIV